MMAYSLTKLHGTVTATPRHVALIAAVLVVAGCRSGSGPSTAYGGGPSVAPTSEISVQDAALAWANEACAREKRCGGIGTGTDVPDLQTCRGRYQAKAIEELAGCNSGRVAPTQLDGCTNMIRSSACAVATPGICNLPAICQTSDD